MNEVKYKDGILTIEHDGRTFTGNGETKQEAVDDLLPKLDGKFQENVLRDEVCPLIDAFLQNI